MLRRDGVELLSGPSLFFSRRRPYSISSPSYPIFFVTTTHSLLYSDRIYFFLYHYFISHSVLHKDYTEKKKSLIFFFSPVFLFLLIHISTSFAALLHYIGNSLFLFILNFHHRNIRLFLLNKQQLQHDDPFMTPIVFSSSSKFALSFAHSPCFAFCLA